MCINDAIMHQADVRSQLFHRLRERMCGLLPLKRPACYHTCITSDKAPREEVSCSTDEIIRSKSACIH